MIEVVLALILSLTGIERTVDPGLTEIAERRVVEIQTDYRHTGCCVEVLVQCSLDICPDPATYAAYAWRDSPDHWHLLTDPAYTQIGCAHSIGANGFHFFACVMGPVSLPTPQPVTTLPNTAIPIGD